MKTIFYHLKRRRKEQRGLGKSIFMVFFRMVVAKFDKTNVIVFVTLSLSRSDEALTFVYISEST